MNIIQPAPGSRSTDTRNNILFAIAVAIIGVVAFGGFYNWKMKPSVEAKRISVSSERSVDPDCVRR